MSEVAEYLMVNYYSRYKGPRNDIVPNKNDLIQALENNRDKVIVVRDEHIEGVAIFVNITDEFYALLKDLDITRFDILKNLLTQDGPNVHFVLLCANGYRTIMTGIKHIKKLKNPRTISWWSPDLSQLHEYKVGG